MFDANHEAYDAALASLDGIPDQREAERSVLLKHIEKIVVRPETLGKAGIRASGNELWLKGDDVFTCYIS